MDEYIRGKLTDLTGVSFQGHASKSYRSFYISATLNARYELNISHTVEFLCQFSR